MAIRYRTNKPTLWNEDRPREAYEIALMGGTDEDVARIMGVDINTINLWKRTHRDFLERLNAGKEIADAHVANALYKRAVGFTVTETHVCMYRGEVIQTPIRKYYPPDSWAANKWLSVRQRTKWADVQRVESVNTQLNIQKFDFTGISDDQLKVLMEIGMAQRHKQLEERYVDQN